MNNFILYVVDIESTGLKTEHDVIELSILRMKDGAQRTWYLKPLRTDNIETDALRVNGHSLNDILHKTAEGREKYKEPSVVISEIENWLNEDFGMPEDRLLVGQNVIGFDQAMLIDLWDKCGASSTFPFSKRRAIDTLQIELFMDYCEDKQSDFYNLSALVEKYKVKKEKAHRADADVRMTRDVFNAQISRMKKSLFNV